MTVRELIALLSAEDPDRIVVMARDAEGNGMSPLDELSTAAYVERWGEAKMESLDEDDIAAGYSEADLAPPGAAPCVVLWPLN